MSRNTMVNKGNSPGVLSFNLDDSWTSRSFSEFLEGEAVSAGKRLRPVRDAVKSLY